MTTWRAAISNLLDAMVRAEGGPQAFVRAVRCSIPTVKDYDEARAIAYTTVLHAAWDFATQDRNAFIDFLAARWAPVGAANDPTHLNVNWPKNVKAFLTP